MRRPTVGTSSVSLLLSPDVGWQRHPRAMMATRAEPKQSPRRVWLLLLGAFTLLWGGYIALLATMPDDAFTVFRNDTFWPGSEHVLIDKQPGVVIKIVVHVAITAALGLILGFVLVGIGAVVTRLGGPTFTRHGLVSYPLAFTVLLFALWVPERVTSIDPNRHEVHVRKINPIAPWSTSTVTVRVTELRGLGVVLAMGGFHGRSRVVRLVAIRRVGRSVLLGETECDEFEGSCLDGAGPALRRILELLGVAETKAVTTNAAGDTRVFEI